MENNNYNGFYGNEPNKPFTEKQENPNPAQNQTEANAPSQPNFFEQTPVKAHNSENDAPYEGNFYQGVDYVKPPYEQAQTNEQPIEQSVQPEQPMQAESNQANEQAAAEDEQPKADAPNPEQSAWQPYSNQNNQGYAGGYYQAQNIYQPYQNAQSAPQYQSNDYSQPVYQQGYGYSQNPQYGGNQAQPYAYNPQPNGYPAQPYGAPAQYAPNQKQPKKKMNGGLIAVIVVLSVFLVGSVAGLAAYVISSNNSSSTSNKTDDSNSYSYTIPYNYGYNETPDTTTAQSEHKETDYSDKTSSDFSGIALNDKPKDATTNSGYTSGYAFDKVSSSVVGVVCYSDEITTVEECSSQGSGIIVSADGYVVTNAHVIGNSKTKYLIQIVTSDGKEYTAGVVGYDSRTDIAVLKMDDAKNLTAATFGNSDDVELGEDILVVGNPGGLDYQNSITKGVVSAVNRELSSTSIVKYIQTDAAINPGNSGGPLVNLYGQVIGIASSKIVSEKYEGMGFAIPSATAKKIIDDLIKNGYVSGRVKIGISGVAIDSATASSYNVPKGILIQEITEGGPCDNTDLQAEDIITEVDGKTVTTFAEIYEILETHKAGDKITIKYYRMSTETEDSIEVTLQEDK
jgi:serine protease Do